MTELAVEVRDLVKLYGSVRALDGISFEVGRGEIFGLVGPNGAGKTTTLRIVATLIKPTSGVVRVFGHDVVREADEVRRLISYLPEEAGAYRLLTGREYLEFMAKVYRAPPSVVEEGIRISGLGDAIDKQVRTYSRGMKRRLLVARTLMVRPRLAILDEPTSGLDVAHAMYVRNVIKEYSREHGVTVLLSSHNMLEIEYLCDRVALIDRGRIVEVGVPRELMERYGAENLEEVFLKVVGR
ncbi:MAG: multidrug ABC transporter ATP-binding protein [Thermoprotei archaeon]|nr:MAG: multidrug ABC transporter ATP-binding protein [Thermoprotei archaeon]